MALNVVNLMRPPRRTKRPARPKDKAGLSVGQEVFVWQDMYCHIGTIREISQGSIIKVQVTGAQGTAMVEVDLCDPTHTWIELMRRA